MDTGKDKWKIFIKFNRKTLENKNNMRFISLILVFTLHSCSLDKQKGEIVDNQIDNVSYVFDEERPFPESHASTLLRMDNGEFLVAWFGGTKEKDDDVGIWMSKGNPNAWTSPKEVAKIRNDAHWNPVLFQDKNGEIYLYFKVGKNISDWETWIMSTKDFGETWTEARELVEGDRGGRGPVRNKPIVLSNGRWLAGASHENNEWEAFVDWSDNEGVTWESSAYIESDIESKKNRGLIQPTLWESAPGNVHMLLRSTEGYIYRSDSENYGTTWSKAYKTTLPNPNSAIDLAQLENGNLALLYNPDGKNWGDRSTLILAFSSDNGKTWYEEILIEDSKDKDAEYSYPAIVAWGNNVALTYTWNRDKIAFWQTSN